MGTLRDPSCSLSKGSQHAQFQQHLVLCSSLCNSRLFSPFNYKASPGSGQNVCQPSYRKPAWAWPSSKKSYTCCSTRLFLRNNHLYSSSIGIHLLSLRWNQTHSNIPKSLSPQSIDASWLLGRANVYHIRALTDGGSSTKWGPRPKRSSPCHYHGTSHTNTYPGGQLPTLDSHWVLEMWPFWIWHAP